MHEGENGGIIFLNILLMVSLIGQGSIWDVLEN